MAAGMAAQGFPPLADLEGAHLGQCPLPAHRLPDIVYYSSPKSKKSGPKNLDEVDPELLKTYAKLGIPLKEQEILSGVASTRCSTRSPWPPPSKRS